MFSVAVATYLSLYPSMLIIPVVLMLTRKINDNDLTKVAIRWLSNAWKELHQMEGYRLDDLLGCFLFHHNRRSPFNARDCSQDRWSLFLPFRSFWSTLGTFSEAFTALCKDFNATGGQHCQYFTPKRNSAY